MKIYFIVPTVELAVSLVESFFIVELLLTLSTAEMFGVPGFIEGHHTFLSKRKKIHIIETNKKFKF